MITDADREKHSRDYEYMASYIEAVIGWKHRRDPLPKVPITLEPQEITDFAWIADQIRRIKQ